MMETKILMMDAISFAKLKEAILARVFDQSVLLNAETITSLEANVKIKIKFLETAVHQNVKLKEAIIAQTKFLQFVSLNVQI